MGAAIRCAHEKKFAPAIDSEPSGLGAGHVPLHTRNPTGRRIDKEQTNRVNQCLIPGGTMTYQSFGVLQVPRADTSVESLSPKPRAILALLMINIGRAVHVDDLVDEVWGDDPPNSALRTLQTYIYQIRRAFGRPPGPEIVTRPLGYELAGVPTDVDAHRFTQLIHHARRTDEGREAASSLLKEALELYKDTPFVDVWPGPRILAYRERLAEMRLCATEHLIAMNIEAGRHREAVEELRPLIREHPLNELLNGYLMYSLAATGRRQEALDVYATLRQGMIDELGLEPCAPLMRLQKQVLSADALVLPFAEAR
ncbi:BTAD domain-containing putative transcriptional regulator [Amycolatopsis sp. NPDC049868]|uniref:AfsR/SARP family transcriptional regulator n=1 Tax=Amycolatopsis sp. NPDC049868 TaxID=3363934 RepID=UPI0037B0812E